MGYAVLIPAYNRPGYLRRLLIYLLDETSASEIVVADDSAVENKGRNKDTIRELDDLRIMYREFHPDRFMYSKLAEAVEHVSEDFCLMCANDDFVVPQGVARCVGFLRDNSEFTCAQGKFVQFIVSKGGGDIRWSHLYPQNSTFAHASPEERYRALNSKYMQTLWATYRTNELQTLLKSTAANTSDLRFGELYLSMATVISGKIKHRDTLYCAREKIPGSSGRVVPDMKAHIENREFSSRYHEYRSGLASLLSEDSNLTVDESRQVIDEGTDTYLRSNYGIPLAKTRRLDGVDQRSAPMDSWTETFLRRVLNRGFEYKRAVHGLAGFLKRGSGYANWRRSTRTSGRERLNLDGDALAHLDMIERYAQMETGEGSYAQMEIHRG